MLWRAATSGISTIAIPRSADKHGAWRALAQSMDCARNCAKGPMLTGLRDTKKTFRIHYI